MEFSRFSFCFFFLQLGFTQPWLLFIVGAETTQVSYSSFDSNEARDMQRMKMFAMP